jgi:putative endonuclease
LKGNKKNDDKGRAMAQNNRETGSRFEEQVADFLKKQGFRILERNFRCREGEIDIIARDGAYLVFIEVKYRRTKAAGSALEAIDARKAARIRRTARFYLYCKRYPEETPCRFDAAGIDGGQITYIKNAFS